MKLAPICLFTYNRLEETKQTVTALQQNFLAKESELFIFSDGAKNDTALEKVLKVRAYLNTIKGFKSVNIIESATNKGLANSIIAGVTQVVNKHERVIVLEDDLVTTPNFLNFMNESLTFFEKNNSIYTVNGYAPLVENLNDEGFYLHSRSFPWGWGTWKNRWDESFFDKEKIKTILSQNSSLLKTFDKDCGNDASNMLLRTLEGTISSWYIRWVFHNYLLKKKSLFPTVSKIQNIGDTELATHYSGGVSAYKSRMDSTYKTIYNFEKIYTLKKRDYRFLRYFSRKYKLLYRLKLMLSIGGINKLYKEVKEKWLKL